MKKKFKLFATIASLCLAVALMAFGVYAATQASLKVGSTVSFDVTSVYATVKIEAFVNGGTTADATFGTHEYRNYTVDTDSKYSLSQSNFDKKTNGNWSGTCSIDSTTGDNLGNVAFVEKSDNTKPTITYKISVTMDNGSKGYISIAGNVVDTTGKISKANVDGETATVTDVEKTAGTTYEYAYTIQLDAISTFSAAQAVEFTITIKNAKSST